MPNLLKNQPSKKTNEEIWQETISSKNAATIKNALKHGIVPRYLNAALLIQNANEHTISKSLMEVILEQNDEKEDIFYFDLADHFLKKGARLPKLFLERNAFFTTSDFFTHLVQCAHDLYIVLRSNPGICKMRDERAKTLLHHTAKAGMQMKAEVAYITRYLLFSSRIDLNARDKDGNTALHIVASPLENISFLTDFLIEAYELGANLTILNNKGQSVLSILERQIEIIGEKQNKAEKENEQSYLQKTLRDLYKLRKKIIADSAQRPGQFSKWNEEDTIDTHSLHLGH